MSAAPRTARTVRQSAAKVETPAPAPKSVRRRRPAPAAKAPAVVKEVQSDALAAKAAPTLLGADGEMVRRTHEYTVDLMAPGVEPERDFAKVMAKDPSEVHLDFVAWVAEHVGYKADPKTVQILISTYHEFQASPAQKAKTQAKRLAAAAKRGEAAARKEAKAKAASAKVEAPAAK